MRIIGGNFRGKKLHLPSDKLTRPLKDIVKESIFNLIIHTKKFNFDIKDSLILDLFSGSGLIGLEFISRGSDVIFVEKNIKCINHISKTLKSLNLNNNTLRSDVFKYLKNSNKKFDFVFADPPYKFTKDQYHHLIELISKNHLEINGTFILEHHKKQNFSKILEFEDSRTYGDCSFSFFQQKSG